MGSFLSSLVNPPAAAAGEEGESAVVALHTQESWVGHWNAHKDTNKLMVIDFSASWCGPCRFIEPAFKALASKYTDVVFAKIDVDELSEVSANWKVQAMPTFLLAKGGKEVGRVVGAKKDELEGKIIQLRA